MGVPPKDDDDDAWLEIVEELSVMHPIPADLRAQVADQIEPVTMDRGIDHDDTMSAIEAAYPLLLSYFGGEVDETRFRHNAPEEQD